MTSGIYKISNAVTGKVYIGSSKHIEKRWKQHKERLKRGRHRNQKLQASFSKHGEQAFLFEVLREVEEKDLIEVEQEFLDLYESWRTGYNIAPVAGGGKRQGAGRKPSGRTERVTIMLSPESAEWLERQSNKSETIDQLILEKVMIQAWMDTEFKLPFVYSDWDGEYVPFVELTFAKNQNGYWVEVSPAGFTEHFDLKKCFSPEELRSFLKTIKVHRYFEPGDKIKPVKAVSDRSRTVAWLKFEA